MARPVETLRFLASSMAPGGVLVLAAWSVQQEDLVRSATAMYAAYFCFGALAAAVLLSWYYDQSRLLCTASAVVLTVLALATDSRLMQLAAVSLLPLNFSLVAVLKERGVISVGGLLTVGIVVAQTAGVVWIADGFSGGAYLGPGAASAFMAWLPWVAQVSFAIGALTLLMLVFSRRTKVEQGLWWALVGMYLGVNPLDLWASGPGPDAHFVYSGTAGLVLVFAVLEHGYDIAYRDELTGLPGRRAFNDAIGRLGGTYAIAMCDVDHFKRFNDTYGHDAGDQVLRKVAATLSHIGGGGRAFRYGGEEFLIVFRGRSAREAEPFAEALRQGIAEAGFVLRGPDRPARKTQASTAVRQTSAHRVDISISIGIAERSKRHSSAELVLDAADAALYRAKETGRNRVMLDEGTPSPTLPGTLPDAVGVRGDAVRTVDGS